MLNLKFYVKHAIIVIVMLNHKIIEKENTRMKNEKRKEAIKKLNQEIRKHLGKLQELIMMEADVELNNGNYIPKKAQLYVDLKKIKEDKENLLITISDLTTICKALERRKTTVVIRGTAKNCSMILIETSKSISAAGLDQDADGFTGEIRLS